MAGVVGYLVGLIALRRTGIYFAMITVAIAEVFFFVEFNPLSAFTGGENGLPGVPTPSFYLGFTTHQFQHRLVDLYLPGVLVFRRHRHRAAHRALAGRRDPVARSATIRCAPRRVGHNIHGYKLTAFVIAAAYAGFAGGLLGVMQGFMPPDAFMFDTSGQLVMQTAIGGAGTLFGPLVGAAVWLYLSDFFQTTLHLGATWKLVLGIVFVLLVCFLRRGIVGGHRRSLSAGARRRDARSRREPAGTGRRRRPRPPAPGRGDAARRRARRPAPRGPILQATGLTKRYGGLVANSDIDFTVNHGELRGIIGPNGAGKSTFFKMLTCEVQPTSGTIVFEGRDITGLGVTDVCQLGLTKSYQVNQLFTRLTVRENLTIAALAEMRGKFRLDLFRASGSVPGLDEQVEQTLALVNLTGARRHAGVGACLWREAAARDRAGARDLAEPAAARRAARRHEPAASASRRSQLLKSISQGRTMIVIDHDMDALFELVERVTVLQEGRVLAEGTPDEIKGNADGAGSLSRRGAREVA